MKRPKLLKQITTLMGSWFTRTPKKQAKPLTLNPKEPPAMLNHNDGLVPYDENLLERARTQWQFGDWQSLANIERDSLQHHPDRAKLALLTAAGHMQLGDSSNARKFTQLAQDWGCSKKLISQILIAGVHNSLGRAAAVNGQGQRALQHFESAIAAGAPASELRLLTQARLGEQLGQLGLSDSADKLARLDYRLKKDKGLFIDGGGYDGCSVIKFLLAHPHYDCVSFEPNPELWHYYDNIPTQLIKKALYIYDGEVDFILDPIDADGSSLMKEKKIDFYQKIKNEDCPLISVECIDLPAFIKKMSRDYNHITLKLDVEGAEYQILNKMLEHGTFDLIEEFFVEFHWNKINLPEESHLELIHELSKKIVIQDWDALDLSVHKKDKSYEKIRKLLLGSLMSVGNLN